MKVTLKSIQAQYAAYGYTFVKSSGNYVEIFFDGVRVRTVCGQSYIKNLEAEMKGCYWMIIGDCCSVFQGQTCELPAAENIQTTLDTEGETCEDKEVKQVSNEKQMDSYFDAVVAMNTRVSDAELNEFENQLQNELYPEMTAEAAMSELEDLWEKVLPTEAIEVTPLDVRKVTEEMKQMLIRQPDIAFDRYPQVDGSEKFVCYFQDWERLGTLTLADGKWVASRLGQQFGLKVSYETTHDDPREAIAVLLGNKVRF